MAIILGIWVGLICLCCNAIAQSKYDPRYISQQVQYDDDQSPYYRHQPKYHAVSSQSLDPYQSHGQYEDPQQRAPASSPYRQPLNSAQQYNYYEPSKQEVNYHASQDTQPRHASYVDHRPTQEVTYIKPKYPEEETALYDSEIKSPIHAEKSEELQYSHEPEQPEHHQAHQEQPSHPHHHQEQPGYPQHHQVQPSRSPHPAPVPHDPKLPLYFTMYEKRIIQDPLDKYGKGPWRYLTYGHGITYGSKEPGKVFERGYGYIRALGRDHCKEEKNLCPPRDEKPFEYDGRKEPYFGYRPH